MANDTPHQCNRTAGQNMAWQARAAGLDHQLDPCGHQLLNEQAASCCCTTVHVHVSNTRKVCLSSAASQTTVAPLLSARCPGPPISPAAPPIITRPDYSCPCRIY